jgi:hypothetical protein
VDPVDRTPTEPADYAALSALYGALLTGTAVSARARQAIGNEELPALAAASFALSKLVVHEKVESWMRRPFVDEGRREPKGRRLRYAVGELLTCTRCTGAWSALGLVALRIHAPTRGPRRIWPRGPPPAHTYTAPHDGADARGDVSSFRRQQTRPPHG